MKIKSGKTRFVIVLPCLGIVIKIPKIRILEALNSSYFSFKNGKLKKALHYPIDGNDITFPLLKGIIENWNESTRRGKFFQKTYLSFLGLINIQKYGAPIPKDVDVWRLLHITYPPNQKIDALLQKDGHHFSQGRNFCIDSGIVKLLDYGGTETKRVVDALGNDFFMKFSSLITAKKD